MGEQAEITEEMRAMFDRDSIDPLVRERGKCLAMDCKSRKYYMILKQCEERVKSKSYTMETCHDEVVDLMEAIDKCVGDKAFLAFA